MHKVSYYKIRFYHLSRYKFLVDRDTSSLYFMVCCANKVAGLYHATLDVYFPIALFSKAPHYFSKRAPYRVVAVAAMGNDKDRGFDAESIAMSGSNLESMLRQLFLTDTATQQEDSGATGTETLVRLDSPRSSSSKNSKWVEVWPSSIPLGAGYQLLGMLLTPWCLCSEWFEGRSICPWQHNCTNEPWLGGASEKDGPVYFSGRGSVGFAGVHGGKRWETHQVCRRQL